MPKQLTLTSTEKCKSLLVLRIGLNSTCIEGSMRFCQRATKSNFYKKDFISQTFEQHLRPISCSTLIDKLEGSTFTFTASARGSLLRIGAGLWELAISEAPVAQIVEREFMIRNYVLPNSIEK